MNNAATSAVPVRAAAYLRMSTESQNYSLEHQEAAIAAYALARGFQVVSTYADGGISGLTLQKREGLKRLLADVLRGAADFSAILTYDVSRWGRFQDIDESAHYEFLCRSAGVHIEYCAEAFDNDGSMVATLLKSIKRVMAAEKSRDLSETITHTKRRMSLKGFWPGGNPSFGLRRVTMPDAQGVVETLHPGWANGQKGRRVRVGLGPPEEVALVRKIFRMCAGGRMSPCAIAQSLNETMPNSYWGEPWTRPRVNRILRDEIYIGTRIYGRFRYRLGARKQQPRSEWIAVPDACPAILSVAAFRAAQRGLERRRHFTNDEMIARLRGLWAKHGYLSHAIITHDPDGPSVTTYVKRFGSLEKIYERIGYTPTARQVEMTARIAPYRVPRRPAASRLTDEEVITRLRTLREDRGKLDIMLIEVTPGLPPIRDLKRRFGSTARIYELACHVPTSRQRVRLGKRADEWSSVGRTPSPRLS